MNDLPENARKRKDPRMVARRPRPALWAFMVVPDPGVRFATGCEARTLELLHRKGRDGVSAYDFPGGPPYRLAAYIHGLKSKFDLVIETLREAHEGGNHARYVLRSTIIPLPLASVGAFLVRQRR